MHISFACSEHPQNQKQEESWLIESDNFSVFNAPFAAPSESVSWRWCLNFTLFLIITPAAITAKPNLFPDLGPLFAPNKRPPASLTSLFR
jgi:hypothetical protein